MGTSYSDFISADSDELTVKIPANYLDGDLELLAVIYAKETFDFSLVELTRTSTVTF